MEIIKPDLKCNRRFPEGYPTGSGRDEDLMERDQENRADAEYPSNLPPELHSSSYPLL